MGSQQDLLGRIREARRRLAADGPSRVRSGGDFERVSVPVSDADVLRDLLLAEKPGTVIEIGLAYGSSALAIAEALVAAGSSDARHVIVDPYQEHFHGSGWAAVTGAGLTGLCSLVAERSQIALPRLLGDGFVGGWEPEPIAWPTRLRAFRLPKPRVEPSFDSFRPFGPGE